MLKQRKKTPNIYALVIKMGEKRILHIGLHYSLEEAYESAVPSEYSENEGVGSLEIEMWTLLKGVDVLFGLLGKDAIRNITGGIVPNDETPEENNEESLVSNENENDDNTGEIVTNEDIKKSLEKQKNQLMEEIIKKNDISLINKYENVFTEHEVKFLKEKIKGDNK